MTEKENYLPNLSSEERAHALELAIQARRRYAALKARVKSGELTFTDAMDEEDAKRILVTSLLQSVPGIGASKAVMKLFTSRESTQSLWCAPQSPPLFFSSSSGVPSHPVETERHLYSTSATISAPSAASQGCKSAWNAPMKRRASKEKSRYMNRKIFMSSTR